MDRRRAAIGGVALVAALGCGPKEPAATARFAVQRFLPRAEEEPRAGFAVIAHERRNVLRAHPSQGVRGRRARAGAETGWLSLAAGFAGARRALVRIQATTPDAPPGRVVPIETVDGAPRIPLPEDWQAERALEVIALPEGDPSQTTAAATLPAEAVLDLGFGLLEADRRGAVEFSLELCEAGECRELLRETLDPSDAAGWQDRRVALADWSGHSVSLRLGARRLDPQDEVSLPVWSTPVVTAQAPRTSQQRSVILISLDTLRADRLDAYGHRDTSPFLAQKFGREGVIFENAVAAATTTGPSHMTLFTSLQPWVHGEGTGPRRGRIDAPTVAELLRAAGFRTAAFTENASINSRRGFARGFEEFGEDKGGVAGLPKGQIERTFGRGLAWLERHREEPFFLFLHTYQTHAPYAPPAEYLARVPAVSGRGGADLRRYDGEIRYVDDYMREFLDALERAALPQVVVIVLSDHGEEFGEHGFRGHALTLHSEITHVPLMLLGAGIPHAVRVPQPVAHVDLLPTILELSGLATPAHAMGRSLVPLWQADGAADGERPAFSETWQTLGSRWDGGQAEVGAPGLAVRLGARKLVRYADPDGALRYEYFELADDPGESHDRYDPGREGVAELRQLLDGYPEQMQARRDELSRQLGLSPVKHAPEIDAEREEKLRALGYIVD